MLSRNCKNNGESNRAEAERIKQAARSLAGRVAAEPHRKDEHLRQFEKETDKVLKPQ